VHESDIANDLGCLPSFRLRNRRADVEARTRHDAATGCWNSWPSQCSPQQRPVRAARIHPSPHHGVGHGIARTSKLFSRTAELSNSGATKLGIGLPRSCICSPTHRVSRSQLFIHTSHRRNRRQLMSTYNLHLLGRSAIRTEIKTGHGSLSRTLADKGERLRKSADFVLTSVLTRALFLVVF
jgi:hypothetical protein